MSINKEKIEEPMEHQRKRLIFRSAHRGTKEMDIVLGSFATQHVPHFMPEELKEYDALLRENDPDLYNWITGKEKAPDNILNLSVYKKLQNHRTL